MGKAKKKEKRNLFVVGAPTVGQNKKHEIPQTPMKT